MTPQETDPDLSVSVQECPVEAWIAVACCKIKGTECSSACMGLFDRGFHYLLYFHHSLVSGEYPSALGSVTASVEGTSEEVEGITTLTIPDITAAEGVTLTATSDTFLCWVDQDNKLLSKDKVFTVKPSADTTYKAVMTAGKAYFQANGLVYGDLNEAVQNAASGSNKVVALLNNGTLEAGTYTIPSGVTLLIPYDDINTLFSPLSVVGKGMIIY